MLFLKYSQNYTIKFFILVRKHDVYKTLNLARKLFAEYLNDDWAISNTSSNNIENIEDIDKASC